MINLQNPVLPIQVNPIEIDRAIFDFQQKLNNGLSWLTHGYGRVYKNLDVTDGSRVYLPEVYLGKKGNDYRYNVVIPDNDKTGQSFFIVRRENIEDWSTGQISLLTYDVGLIFTVNLELADVALVDTDYFQQNLVAEVREVIRNITAVPYDITLTDVEYLFDDVFRDFQIDDQEQLEKSPFTHFRLNMTLRLYEECNAIPIDNCQTLLNNITPELLCDCVIPSIDWNVNIGCLTAQQVTDLTTILCTPVVPVNEFSMGFDGIDEYILTRSNLPAYDLERTDSFTFSFWLKPSLLQRGSIINKFDVPTGYNILLTEFGEIRILLANHVGLGLSIDLKTNPNSVVLNQWQHICITYNGSSVASGIKIYIDNVLQSNNVTTDNLNATISNSAILTFGAFLVGGRYYAGLLDEVRMWNIEFDATQVNTEYNGGSATAEVNESGNNFVAFGCGDDSIFGFSNRHFPDRLQTNPLLNGFYASQNAELGDMTTDIS